MSSASVSLCSAAPSAPAQAAHIHRPAFGKRSPRRLCCFSSSCDVHCTTSLSSPCLQYFPSCLAIFAHANITLATALFRCSTAHRVPPPLQPPRVLRASSPTTDIGPYKSLCRDCFSSVMKKNGDGHETRTAKSVKATSAIMWLRSWHHCLEFGTVLPRAPAHVANIEMPKTDMDVTFQHSLRLPTKHPPRINMNVLFAVGNNEPRRNRHHKGSI